MTFSERHILEFFLADVLSRPEFKGLKVYSDILLSPSLEQVQFRGMIETAITLDKGPLHLPCPKDIHLIATYSPVDSATALNEFTSKLGVLNKVHRDAGKDPRVFGIFSTGTNWIFLRIGQDGVVEISPTQGLINDDEVIQLYVTIYHFIGECLSAL
jgi:hypothetical protein